MGVYVGTFCAAARCAAALTWTVVVLPEQARRRCSLDLLLSSTSEAIARDCATRSRKSEHDSRREIGRATTLLERPRADSGVRARAAFLHFVGHETRPGPYPCDVPAPRSAVASREQLVVTEPRLECRVDESLEDHPWCVGSM